MQSTKVVTNKTTVNLNKLRVATGTIFTSVKMVSILNFLSRIYTQTWVPNWSNKNYLCNTCSDRLHSTSSKTPLKRPNKFEPQTTGPRIQPWVGEPQEKPFPGTG